MANRLKTVQLDLDTLGRDASFALLLNTKMKVTWGNPSFLKKINNAIGLDASELIRFYYPSSKRSRRIDHKSISSRLGKRIDLQIKNGEISLYVSGKWMAARNGFLLLADPCRADAPPPPSEKSETDAVMEKVRRKQHAREKLVRAAGTTENEGESPGLNGWKALSNIPRVGIAIADSEWKIVFCNEYMAKLHRRTVEEVTGECLAIFHTPEQMKRVEQLNQTLRNDGIFSNEEVSHVDREGKEFPMLMNGSAIQESDGSIRHIGVSAVDIRERRKEEEQLVHSENRYRSLLSNLPIGIFRTTADAKFISANPAMVKMHGCDSEDELLHKRTTDFWIDPNQRDYMLTKLQKEGLVEDFPVPIRPMNGPILQTIISVHAVSDTNGNILHLDGIMLDVTARKMAEDALDEHARMLKIINEVITEGNRGEDIPTLLRNTLDISLDLMEFSGGGIYLVDEESRTACLSCHIGLEEKFVKARREIPIDREPYSQIFLDGKTIATSDYASVNPDVAREHGFKTAASTPLLAGKKIIGALNLATMTKRPMSTMDKETFCSIGKELGTAVARMQAVEDLRKSEERFRTTFRLSPDALFLETMDGQIIDVNPRAEETTGYTREELLRMKAGDLITKETAEKVDMSLMDKEQIRPIFMETVNLHKNGTNIPVEVHIQKIEIGNENYILVGVRDITERKMAEKAIRESEHRFRESSILLETVLNSIPDIIGVQDRHHNILRYNDAGYNFLGLSPDQIKGKKCYELIGRESPCDMCATLTVYETKKPAQVEKYIEELGLWFDVRAYPILDHSGEIVRVIEHLRDITEQKEARRTIEESEKKYRLIVENQTDLVVELDGDGNFLFASPSFCEMFDVPEEAVIGKHISTLGYGPGKETLLKLVRDLRELPHRSYVEQQEMTPEGLKWFAWALKAVPGTDGIPDSIIAVGRDITRRKCQEIELKSSEERLRVLFEYAPDACFLTDMNGDFVDGNRAVRKLLGYDKEELAGQNLLGIGILPPELFQTPGDPQTHSDGSSTTNEHQARHKDGGWITAETKAYPVDLNGQETLLCISRDITARKQAETERTKLLAGIRERVKELNCLYRISELSETPGVSIEEILPVIVDTIPSAFSYPSTTCARITFGDREFATDNWLETQAEQGSDIRVHGEKTGRIDVCCLEEGQEEDRAHFVKEKQDLIGAIAKRLGGAIERSRAEEDLAQKERLYRTLIETVEHVIWLGETDGRITFFNSAWEKMTGRTPDDSFGMKWSELIHSNDVTEVLEKWESACTHGEGFHTECRLLSKEADWLTIQCTASPVRDNFGTIVKWVGLIMDITTRRLAEEESRKTHVFLDSIIENLPSMLCVKDSTDLKYVRLNKAGEDLLGYPRDELIGRTGFEIFPAQDALTSTYDDRNVLKSGKSADSHEELIQTRYKGFRTLQTKKIPLLNDEGEPEHLLSISQDITERKLAEEALRLQSEILENMVEGVCLIRSLDATIVYVNPAFENMCGYDPGDLINKHAGILDVPPTSARENRNTDMILNLQKESTWNGEVHSRKRDDSTFWSRVNVSTFDHPRYGRVWVAVYEDISEQKMLQTQLLQAQKLEAVGQLASGIAHEINTPIQYVGDNTHFLNRSLTDLLELFRICREIASSATDLTDGSDLGDRYGALLSRLDMDYLLEEIPKATRHSIEGIEHVSEIVQAMREFSHPSLKDKSMVDLNRLIRTTLTFTKNEWKYTARVETDLDPTLPMIPCIPGEFTQAILNLVVNSAHAITERYGETSDRKGVITICSRLDEECVEISIADTGIGIPDEHRYRIFDPFFTTKEVGKGSGQGLAIVRSVVVDKHGGELSFQSEVGIGSTFTIRLPLIGPDTPTEVDHEGKDSVRG